MDPGVGRKPTPSPFPKEIFKTHLTNQRAMNFIERQAGGPFAAWISIRATRMEISNSTIWKKIRWSSKNAHGGPEYRKVEQELSAELATMK
jgi:hypothetical protein